MHKMSPNNRIEYTRCAGRKNGELFLVWLCQCLFLGQKGDATLYFYASEAALAVCM